MIGMRTIEALDADDLPHGLNAGDDREQQGDARGLAWTFQDRSERVFEMMRDALPQDLGCPRVAGRTKAEKKAA